MSTDNNDIDNNENGQTTAEYALVLVGAATIAMLIIAWAGSTTRISGLLDTVLRSITALVA
jgi:Flp pilus assembly pilin Flp